MVSIHLVYSVARIYLLSSPATTARVPRPRHPRPHPCSRLYRRLHPAAALALALAGEILVDFFPDVDDEFIPPATHPPHPRPLRGHPTHANANILSRTSSSSLLDLNPAVHD
ncbi:hypothetical protein C8R45DRAFT_974348 [Mycena sanguinolenta]|nr:hypothetical protein C8R45DRAFT_974348 [Mycena sanguinolenta]